MDVVDQLFGKVALKNRLVTEDQIRECADTGIPLGKALLARGYLSEKQYSTIDQYVQQKTGAAVADQPPGAGEGPARTNDRPPGTAATVVTPPSGRAPAAGGGLPPLVDLLKLAKESGASDLHISVAAKPFIRLHGEIRFLEDLPLILPEAGKQRIFEVLTPALRQRFEERLDLDTCLEVPGLGRFRTSVLRQRRGVAAVFRVIRDKIPTLEELGLPDSLRKFTTYHQGIVLVTGPAGSGKSSTMAALIEIVNQTRKDHIITLEDPIEYIFECKKANISQRQIEAHTLSWANALRASLREDPDVIMVGEMRDLDTMRLAVTAAETGHLVLATLHTTNATRTIDRLLDVFPPKEQPQIRAMVSESLRGVVSQQLVPRADGKGRVPAIEVLFTTPAVANLIRERKTFQLFSVLQTGRKLGMRLMDDSLAELVERKLITRDQGRFRATNPRRFEGKGRA